MYQEKTSKLQLRICDVEQHEGKKVSAHKGAVNQSGIFHCFFSIFLTKLIFQVTSKTMILGWGQLETLKQDRLSLDCGIFVNVMMYE